MHAVAPGRQLRRLNFVPAQRQDAHTVRAEDLQNLILLNDPPEAPAALEDAAMTRSSGRAAGRGPTAHKELFRAEDLSLQWREMRKAGAGLQNLGNTCFMNSVLQSLVHTPPLAELLLSGGSGRLHNGAVNGFYPIQLARELVSHSLAHTTRSPLAPMNFAKSLRRISRSFRLGRQEDAHEFLIALLDAMHEASIAGLQPKPPPEVAQTSFVYRIFGGRMRSQVKCCECGYESNTYDPCIDLSLEIMRAQSVKRALERFTAGEALDGANKYKCPRQSKAVRAVKRMTVDTAPNVLMIQLKRFEFSFSGHKISKKVDFELELDLAPYMSEVPPAPAVYDLYAVLVHSGHSVHSGHYYAYVRAPNGIWHICDDTHVAQVAERQVMAQKAYILFYLKRHPGTRRALPPASSRGIAAAVAPPVPSSIVAAAPSPVAARRPDVQQPMRQDTQQVAAVAAVTGTGSRNGKQREAAAVEQQQQQQPHAVRARDAAEDGEQRKSKSHRQVHQEQQQNGHVGKKARLCSRQRVAATGADGDEPPLSPLPRLRPLLVPSPLAGLALSRRGARLAQVLSIAQRQLLRTSRLLQHKARHKAAMVPSQPADASDEEVAAGGREGSAGSTVTSVVSAPDWPPIKQRGAAATAAAAAAVQDGDCVDQEQQGRRQRRQQQQQQQQQHEEQQEQERQAAAAAPPRTPSSASNGSAGWQQQAGDVRAFLHSSSGGSRLRLEPWENVEASEKQLRVELLRKEAPKRRRQDEYDADYDRGRTKKVRAKHGDDDGNENRGSGVGGESFDAAWRQQQRDGVQTELRGNRKRRSAEHHQQQQNHHQRHSFGSGDGGGREGRHGDKRHSFGGRRGGGHGSRSGRGGRGRGRPLQR